MGGRLMPLAFSFVASMHPKARRFAAPACSATRCAIGPGTGACRTAPALDIWQAEGAGALIFTELGTVRFPEIQPRMSARLTGRRLAGTLSGARAWRRRWVVVSRSGGDPDHRDFF